MLDMSSETGATTRVQSTLAQVTLPSVLHFTIYQMRVSCPETRTEYFYNSKKLGSMIAMCKSSSGSVKSSH